MQFLQSQSNHRHWRFFQQSVCSKVAGMLLVLLAMAFVGTGTAHASCGDYLASHGSSEAMQVNHPPHHASSWSDSEDQQAPCNGPSCSRQSEFPASPVPPPVVQNGGDKFGIPNDGAPPLVLSCSERLSGDALLLQHGFRLRIERPPRVLLAVL